VGDGILYPSSDSVSSYSDSVSSYSDSVSLSSDSISLPSDSISSSSDPVEIDSLTLDRPVNPFFTNKQRKPIFSDEEIELMNSFLAVEVAVEAKNIRMTPQKDDELLPCFETGY
jgi:hypothetical protein